MTVQQLMQHVGTRVLFREQSGLLFEVTVKDARPSYGRVNLLIEPVAGSGERWVAESSITPIAEGAGK